MRCTHVHGRPVQVLLKRGCSGAQWTRFVPHYWLGLGLRLGLQLFAVTSLRETLGSISCVRIQLYHCG